MVTPLKERDQLDIDGLERLVEHILAGGVHGLFILGTTGEGPSLSYKLRMELIERVCRQTNGRVPILVGVTDTSFAESVNLAEHAADEGAAAVVLSAPYYFPLRQQELTGYVERIAAEIPLPIFLYNMPSHTKLVFEIDLLKRALELPNIVGLKDSSGQFVYFQSVQHVVKERADFSLLVGPEELLAATVLLGSDGGVPGGSNLFPRLYVNLFQAASDGDLPLVQRLHEQVMRISTTLYRVGNYGSGITIALKSALTCLGICGPAMAEPFTPAAFEDEEKVRRVLAELEAFEPELCSVTAG
jgi:dihydrodipicolinate synthase/N-acetylneuraminate lyase